MERSFLILQLERISSADRKTKELFASIFSLQYLKKNEELKWPVAPGRSICFNLDGLLHHFQKTQGRKQSFLSSLQFYISGQLFTLPDEKYPDISIVAIRPSRILFTDFHRLTAIIQKDLAVIELLEELHQHFQSQDHKRIMMLTATPAALRYGIASEHLGLELYHIPKYLLASYLNISRKQLQRINYQQLLGNKSRPPCNKPS